MTDAEPFATPRVAAGILYFNAARQILLVDPTYKQMWELPGGYLQPGESPTEALRRELIEELGVALPVGQLLVADWAPREGEGDKLLFVFDGGVLTQAQIASITVDGKEISEFAFHDRGDVDRLLIPRLARRVHAALDAREHGATLYLEHGRRHAPAGEADIDSV
jgi:8-oxo-dGTP diphosphatase